MLSRLHLQNFTVFDNADFQFSEGLNVIIGTNGAGKSHVLKMGYTVLSSLQTRLSFYPATDPTSQFSEDQTQASGARDKLLGVFRPMPEKVGELIRKAQSDQDALINYEIDNNPETATLAIYAHGSFMESAPPLAAISAARSNTLFRPVFIPAKEVVTLSWMLPISENYRVAIDGTYIDLLRQLRGLPLLQPEPAAATAIKALTDILGGEIEEKDGRYYLTTTADHTSLEVNMMAEGLRKFGMLQKLLSNGSLRPRTTLFWDEPEANLNPVLLRKLAELLAELAQNGFQVILATHSLFLLKQFHILSRQKAEIPLPIRYFGLSTQQDTATVVVAKDDFEHLPDIVALDEELAQADELTLLFAQDDAHADGR